MTEGFPLPLGERAPDFELPAVPGGTFRLSAHRGHPVVLYFYPADGTEGCTIENREFTTLADRFAELGAVVVGISPDGMAGHKAFRTKCSLALPLLSDPEHQVLEIYGVWGPKVTFGHHHIGVRRTTVLIDREGRIALIWPVRRVKGHAAEVLAAVENMG